MDAIASGDAKVVDVTAFVPDDTPTDRPAAPDEDYQRQVALG
jgi:hypothetical protein